MAGSCEHGIEGCVYCDDTRPCLFNYANGQRCVATAAPGWHYCAVHHPEKILERAKNVAFNNFAPAIAASDAATSVLLKRVYDDLLYDLERLA